MNSFVDDVKTGGITQNSFIGNWFNRRQGFERLEQYSDEENGLFDGKIAHHSNDDSDEETFNVANKPQGILFNNKNPITTIKIDVDVI